MFFPSVFLFSITSSTSSQLLFLPLALLHLTLQFALFCSRFGWNLSVFCDLRGWVLCIPSSVWAAAGWVPSSRSELTLSSQQRPTETSSGSVERCCPPSETATAAAHEAKEKRSFKNFMGTKWTKEAFVEAVHVDATQRRSANRGSRFVPSFNHNKVELSSWKTKSFSSSTLKWFDSKR